tara:strand:+ start:1947 stop:2357 length:411 start_codon:yes stop_codon:yes gene_type:complete
MPISIRKIHPNKTIDIRHEAIWPDKKKEFCILEDDKNGTHFGLYKQEELISIISLFIRGDKARIRKMATKPAFQNKGFGSKLIYHSISYLELRNINYMYLFSRKKAQKFYEKFGFLSDGDYFKKENIFYIRMYKNY